MKGTWRGSGTFETRDGDGIITTALAYGLVALAVFAAAMWLWARRWWIIGGGGAVIAVAVFVAWRIMRRARAADLAAIALAGQRWHAVQADAKRQTGQVAIEQRPVIINNFYGADGEHIAARVIRKALPGQSGAITNQEE